MKTAIITGASRGVGRATALALTKDYDYIAINCIKNEQLLNEVKSEIELTGTRCLAMTGDISDYTFANEFVTSILNETEHIDLLVNNAGISIVGLFTDMEPAEWKRIFASNVDSCYNMSRLVLPSMIRRHSGRIINISSVWGNVGASCEVAYSATKGAINSLSKALGKELAPSNIAVNAIALGAVDTDMNSHLNIEEKEILEEEIPFGRMAKATEAADFILGITRMPNYYTGNVVTFDGGWI